MKRLLLFLFVAGLFCCFLSGQPLLAQNAVVNPLFQTGDLTFWQTTGSGYAVIIGPANLGMDQYCVKKSPGGPDHNGSIIQNVHLIGGHTYKFSAKIAAKYCSS